MNLKEMSVESLKALAYDQLAILEATRNNINTINAEIKLKSEVKEANV